MHKPIPERTEKIGAQVIDAAIKVHRALGPGLLESVYEACLCFELSKRGIPFRRQVDLPVRYEGVFVETGFRIDVLVDGCVLAEIKSTVDITPLFECILLTHLRLADIRLGFILNFNVQLMKDGIKRMVN
jgi:GxxExxY protein